RYFEKAGLLEEPPRTDGGHRMYAQHHVRALSFIKHARQLGFAAGEVRSIMQGGGPEKAVCSQVREIAAHHLAQVRAKMSDLAEIERQLASTIEQCSGDAVSDCAVIEMIEERPDTDDRSARAAGRRRRC
ncbi:MAG: MerR family DNA-binding protein, partial [Gemmatimonadaceae bacterium]